MIETLIAVAKAISTQILVYWLHYQVLITKSPGSGSAGMTLASAARETLLHYKVFAAEKFDGSADRQNAVCSNSKSNFKIKPRVLLKIKPKVLFYYTTKFLLPENHSKASLNYADSGPAGMPHGSGGKGNFIIPQSFHYRGIWRCRHRRQAVPLHGQSNFKIKPKVLLKINPTGLFYYTIPPKRRQ